jgi:hypothetical protein
LHALWDTGLIRHLNEDPEALAARLRKLPIASKPATVAQFAEESCRIVGQPDFCPGHVVDARHIEKFTPVVEQRLKVAAGRLASLLNQVLRQH